MAAGADGTARASTAWTRRAGASGSRISTRAPPSGDSPMTRSPPRTRTASCTSPRPSPVCDFGSAANWSVLGTGDSSRRLASRSGWNPSPESATPIDSTSSSTEDTSRTTSPSRV